jgi:hypothetical protein
VAKGVNILFTELPSTTSLITKESLEKSFLSGFVVGKSRSLWALILLLLGPNGRNMQRHFLLIQRLSRAWQRSNEVVLVLLR